MNNATLVVMNSLLTSAASVTDSAALKHMKAAFSRLAVVASEQAFTISDLVTSPPRVQFNGVSYPLTFGDITLTPSEFYALVYNGKLDAVKEYRNRTGKGLMDSKKDIESYMFGTNAPVYRNY